MLTEEQIKQLQKANYKVIGKNKHSAVKLCLWLKKSIKTGEKEFCYKQKWHGIKSHRCLQMTPSMTVCNLRCMHCWREHSYFTGQEKWDSPEEIIEESIKAQKELLTGLGGVPHSEKHLREAYDPKSVAISLDGEPTLYPYLKELIAGYHKLGMKTFLVTNGMRPDVLANLDPLPTNLYVSITSNSKEMFNETQHPIPPASWEKLIETLKLLPKLNTRKVVRITVIKGVNMNHPEKYAELLEIGKPDFVEVKAYMSIGGSLKRGLGFENMPSMEEVEKFAREIAKHCEYKFVDNSPPSRVTLLARK